MMKSERLDYKIIRDYEQMHKLGYSLNNNVVPALNNFQEFASDTYNYLILPCIASPRYKTVLSTDGEWYDVVQDTKVCKYFYEIEKPNQPFLKNEPSFFRYYDYLNTVSSDVLSTDQTFYITKNCISEFPVPNYVIYEGVSSVTQDGEILSSPSISSCWSPVLLDNQNARWYQSLWNSFFKVVTKPNLILIDEWKVSSPVINNTDNSFNNLLNLPWTALSAYHVSSDMNRQYYEVELYPGPYYPVTRYCLTYDKIMHNDGFDRMDITKVYEWEKEHMSSPYFYFWKPIADFIGDSLPGFPITRRTVVGNVIYENHFVLEKDKQFILGGNNTISVGLDDYGWNHMRPDYSNDLSTWSWLSKPFRTTDVKEYEEGLGKYLVFSYNTTGYVQRYWNPKIQPPKKVVAQNLYALAYYWNKFLSPKDEDGNPKLEEYYSTAIGTQYIPFRQMDREENVTVTWTLHPVLSATDISGCIGFMEITQNIVKDGTGWILSEINENSFSFYRKGSSGVISSYPLIQDGLLVLYGDLQGVQVIGSDLSSVTLVYTLEKDEYFKQYLKLFPKSQEEQRRLELSALKEKYDAYLSALSAAMDEAFSALSAAEDYKQEITDGCYFSGYHYAWNKMGLRYSEFKGNDISSFIEFANNPPYADAVSGYFNNIGDLDYKGKVFNGINEYISSDAYLSTYGSVNSIEDLDELYNAFILKSDLSSTYIQTIAGMCKDVNDIALDCALGFRSIPPDIELTQESVLDFAVRLEANSSSVGELWRIFLEDYVNLNLESLLLEYYAVLQLVQDRISGILMRMDLLTQKYYEDLAEIGHKEYPIDLPDFSKLDLLYEKRYRYNASVIDGNGWISLSRRASVKMGVEDGQLEQEANYDGMRYRYPYSYENEPNLALEKASYLLYGMRTRYGLDLEDQITEIKPFVFQNCHSYDEFRRDGIKSIENEIKNDVGYHSKDLWWNGEYSENELKKFNLSSTVLLYGEESQGTWTPIARDLGSTVIVHIINGDDGSKMGEFEAEKIAVEAFFNSEGGIKTQSLNMSLRYDVPSTLGKSPELKIKDEDFVKVYITLLPQVMCEAKWICQQ